MIRLAIAGARGRTGQRVLELAAADQRFEIAAALVKSGDAENDRTISTAGRSIPLVESLDRPCDVLVDFTVADGTVARLAECQKLDIPMVIGVTGHDERQLAAIHDAAHHIPIVKAANFSIGVNVLLELLADLARKLGDEYDVEIVEAHHRHKVDAPSGTALSFADAILTAKGRSRDDLVFGRKGPVGQRPKRQVGIHAVRMGEVVGTHELYFSGPGETLCVRHAAHSRDTFAAGALRAAAWVVGKPPGLYTMRDVIA